MRNGLISQLQSSILLGALSLIPHNALRYTLLVIAVCLALLYAVHLKRPSTQLSQLEVIVQKTDKVIRDAKLHCARDFANLLEKWAELLKIKRSASEIQSRILETNTLTWTEYRLLSGDISDCAKSVKEIRTAVQLIVEAERQRKYTEDINETEAILAAVRAPTRIDGAYGMMEEMSNLNSILHSSEAVIDSLNQFDTSIDPPESLRQDAKFRQTYRKFSTKTPFQICLTLTYSKYNIPEAEMTVSSGR
ncbi:hypothetical protein FB451DRAFT_1441351 [Mycena latifolia]|nr:hypothetical protein FB451DRAFT_1441351 [Mycena latifolia]